jgi:hypothetical protein
VSRLYLINEWWCRARLKARVVAWRAQRHGKERDLAPLWAETARHIEERIMHDNVRCFLRWPEIVTTMNVIDAPYVRQEWEYLQSRVDWASRWQEAIRETPVGAPVPYQFHPASSANLIHQAYHLARFQEATGFDIGSARGICEIGGGYGCLCRLAFRLGFAGSYTIVDVPPMGGLQEYYLSVNRLPMARRFGGGAGIRLVEDVERLARNTDRARDGTVFVATWSLSEMPDSLRARFLGDMANFSAYLIAYQERFGENDNGAFFERLVGVTPDVKWERSEIAHIPGNSYLFGVRRQ